MLLKTSEGKKVVSSFVTTNETLSQQKEEKKIRQSRSRLENGKWLQVCNTFSIKQVITLLPLTSGVNLMKGAMTSNRSYNKFREVLLEKRSEAILRRSEKGIWYPTHSSQISMCAFHLRRFSETTSQHCCRSSTTLCNSHSLMGMLFYGVMRKTLYNKNFWIQEVYLKLNNTYSQRRTEEPI